MVMQQNVAAIQNAIALQSADLSIGKRIIAPIVSAIEFQVVKKRD
jgi:hypothetical protein